MTTKKEQKTTKESTTTKKTPSKKVEVTNDTKVKVYNNRNHRVNFKLAGGNVVVLGRLGEYKEVRVEDLEMVLSDAKAMLTEGSLLIKDKDVQKYLGIDEYYKTNYIMEYAKIEDIFSKDIKDMKEVLESASPTIVDEIYNIAQTKLYELTVTQVKLIEEYTGKKLIFE